ncbi:Asp23/Gls24 family envelope stress response protein [Williamsia sterculiae]|uniref:Uncharacterized conserved protein YloU, alkaline shock protein (Asp23) family n=1 Tax=Williamsia sterculiae TaxID=1344003 RepID=A0A1N7HCP9_9NOCA|nr:Asp23/Gls24 family envelope stress response protein [Williamsia sterculiae]SIS22458.1 Uncharacterized conserved protein YloU, alkaline shock protein (Asp23) family [Williamsia sterculiae]
MTTSSTTSRTGTTTAGASKDLTKSTTADSSSELVNEHGRTSIADTVVAKIAGIATREIDGVYDLGGSASRMVGKVRDVIPGTGTNVTQGVTVEVGEKQAAVDIGLVADYGVAIHQLAAAIRSNVINAIGDMTGLEVTEVNVTVHDVHLAEDDDDSAPAEPRVQ